MDASVTPLRHGGLSLVQTTDFFYPLVDDPYMMGEWRCQMYRTRLFSFKLCDEQKCLVCSYVAMCFELFFSFDTSV